MTKFTISNIWNFVTHDACSNQTHLGTVPSKRVEAIENSPQGHGERYLNNKPDNGSTMQTTHWVPAETTIPP
jgi:hypothetical protein